MKARGTRGGILLSLEPGDDAAKVAEALADHAELLQEKVAVELTERTPFALLETIAEKVENAGGTFTDVRPPTALLQARGETVIVARTIRSGGRVESTGSVVVLGDVNAGAEILANDEAYAPASTFKIVTSSTLLEEGYAGRNTKYPCSAAFRFGGITWRNWATYDKGAYDVMHAIADSCNTYYFYAAYACRAGL